MKKLTKKPSKKITVAIIMGSDSDFKTMKEACSVLKEFGISYSTKIISAHRTPDLVSSFAKSAAISGIKAIIAGAGGAAHLPGMVAAHTELPVIGVPVESRALKGLDSLLSIVQMPKGIPVATVSIGGAYNAGLLAAQIIGVNDKTVFKKMTAYKKKMESRIRKIKLPNP